jgi:hypothetical protein
MVILKVGTDWKKPTFSDDELLIIRILLLLEFYSNIFNCLKNDKE